MPLRNLGWLLGVVGVFALGFAVAYTAPSEEKSRDYGNMKLLVDVMEQVRKNYVTELTPDQERKLFEDMINGGLERLDPHSAYINPHDLKQFDKSSKGSFGGIGIQLGTDRQNHGQLTVISPMVGTPAYEKGVLAGDAILKIEGKSTEGMRIGEAVDLITGDIGKDITLTIQHEGAKEPIDVTITRAEIKVQSVMGDQRKPDNPKAWEYMLDKENRIGYIRLTAFSENAAQELRDAVAELEKDGVRGLILDLRNNPGGLLEQAVKVSDLFLTEGPIVTIKGRNDKEKVYEAHEAGTMLVPAEKYPMVVLVNKFAASASEIVSAALQDHKRAVVIGERSYGKGSVQNVIKLDEGEHGKSALKLTTASYWRPSGKNIHRFPDSKESDEWGVKPNEGFEVPMKDEERLEYLIYRNDRDVVRGKNAPAKSEEKKEEKKDEAKDGDKKEKKPFEDRVLQKALDYMRGEIKKVGAAPMLPEVLPS
jgi:carboxyl-terminal processing protease